MDSKTFLNTIFPSEERKRTIDKVGQLVNETAINMANNVTKEIAISVLIDTALAVHSKLVKPNIVQNSSYYKINQEHALYYTRSGDELKQIDLPEEGSKRLDELIDPKTKGYARFSKIKFDNANIMFIDKNNNVILTQNYNGEQTKDTIKLTFADNLDIDITCINQAVLETNGPKNKLASWITRWL